MATKFSYRSFSSWNRSASTFSITLPILYKVILLVHLFLLFAPSSCSPSSSFLAFLNDHSKEGSKKQPLNDVKPMIVSESQNMEVQGGSEIRLPCEVKDLGEYVILWRRRANKRVLFVGFVRVSAGNRMNLGPRNELVIDNITKDDEGDYTCEVSTNPPLTVRHELKIYDLLSAPKSSNEVDRTSSGTLHLDASLSMTSSAFLSTLCTCISVFYAVKSF